MLSRAKVTNGSRRLLTVGLREVTVAQQQQQQQQRR